MQYIVEYIGDDDSIEIEADSFYVESGFAFFTEDKTPIAAINYGRVKAILPGDQFEVGD